MDQAMQATGLRTKTKVVEAALRALLLLKEQREIRDLRGRLRPVQNPSPRHFLLAR
jgi:Arc/MetJ family transcription regulator